MKKILLLAVAGAFFVSSTAMAQNNYNNCDGSGMGYHRNMTSEQHSQMMKDRAQYHNNRMKQANNNYRSNNYMNHGNHRHNTGYHMNANNHRNNNNHRGQGRMYSNW